MVHSELVKLILIDDNALCLLDRHASDVSDKFKAVSARYEAIFDDIISAWEESSYSGEYRESKLAKAYDKSFPCW
jgi:hypothetical protein